MAINWPHYPMQGTQRWRDAYAGRMEDPQRRRYAELVSTTDELIGQVISQGETRHQAVFGCDWLPTIADDAGCSLADGQTGRAEHSWCDRIVRCRLAT